MTANAQQALAPGVHIESFEIVRVLGTGGFGITYEAWDHRLRCQAAVKEYLPSDLAARADNGLTVEPSTERAQDAAAFHDGLQRFLDEARILARFRDPYVIGVKQFISANGTAYLIMDYERGRNLSEHLAATPPPMPAAQLRHLLDCLLSGLATLHAHGVLHRDIKPANVYLRENGDPVLIDFGSARHTVRAREAQDLTSVVTHGYAPHEQYHRRGRQGPWTDLYALGATLYYCLCGHKPAGGMDRLLATQDGWPDPQLPAAEAAPAGYDDQLIAVIDWLLRVQVDQRPTSAQAVREALAGRRPIPPPPSPEPASTSPPRLDDGSTLLLNDDTVAPAARSHLARPAHVFTAAAIVAVVLGLAGLPFLIEQRLTDVLPQRIAEAGEQAFGLPTTVQGAHAAPYSRRFTISGLSVANPQGYRHTHALEIDTITVTADSYWWWLQSAPRLVKVEVSGVSVYYEAGDDPQRSNLSGLTARHGSEAPAPTPIEVAAINVTDGRVNAANFTRSDEVVVKPLSGFTLTVSPRPSRIGLNDALRMVAGRLAGDAVRVAQASAPMRELIGPPHAVPPVAARRPPPVTPETFAPIRRNDRSLPQRVVDWIEHAEETLSQGSE